MAYRDIVPVLAAAFHGSAPTTSLDATGGHSVLGGGMDYVPEPEPVLLEDKKCTQVTKEGVRCQAWAAPDGLCNGHRMREWKLANQ